MGKIQCESAIWSIRLGLIGGTVTQCHKCDYRWLMRRRRRRGQHQEAVKCRWDREKYNFQIKLQDK